MIGNALVLHSSKACGAKKFAPFRRREQVRPYCQQAAPLMRVRIVPIIVDENPGRAAGFQHAKNFADAHSRIGPVVRRLDGNGMRKEIRLPGNFLDFPGDEHQVFEIHTGAASVADHFVGNVHSHHAALRNKLGQSPRKPARSASHVEHIVRRRQPHLFQHRKGNGQVVLLHALATACFRPAVELFAQHFARLRHPHTPFNRFGQLHRPPAVGAYLGARRRQSTAVTAESPGTYGSIPDLQRFVGSHGPDQRGPPANDGPTQKEVHKKNT